jgi:hypothetical protein
VVQGIGPEFKAQYHKKKLKKEFQFKGCELIFLSVK